jgi:hypothetical protein
MSLSLSKPLLVIHTVARNPLIAGQTITYSSMKDLLIARIIYMIHEASNEILTITQ